MSAVVKICNKEDRRLLWFHRTRTSQNSSAEEDERRKNCQIELFWKRKIGSFSHIHYRNSTEKTSRWQKDLTSWHLKTHRYCSLALKLSNRLLLQWLGFVYETTGDMRQYNDIIDSCNRFWISNHYIETFHGGVSAGDFFRAKGRSMFIMVKAGLVIS